jgi:hypothetical protein
MKRTILPTACALALSAASASAQPSQGRAGSENGPASNSVTTNGTGVESRRVEPGVEPGTVGASRGPVTIVRPGPDGVPYSPGDTSSEGNVGPGTSNNTLPAPGGR